MELLIIIYVIYSALYFITDHPEIQDELEKHDTSLVDRVSTLQLDDDSIDKLPKVYQI